MTLLKDIRLLLIVGLAIICLLALRLCSSEYQPVAGSTTTESEANKSMVAQNDDDQTAESQPLIAASDTTGESADDGGETVKETTAADAEEAGPTDSTSEEIAVTPDTTVTPVTAAELSEVQAELAADDDGSDSDVEAESSDNQVTEGSDAAETKDSEQTEPSTLNPTGDDSTNSETADMALSDMESTDGDTEPTPTKAEAVKTVFEVVPSSIGEPADVAVEKIEFSAPAASGNIIQDLRSDVESAKEGLIKYDNKLELIDTIVEKMSNPE